MTLKVIATGFNSRLCKQLQHNGLVVDVELSRYCQTLITEPSVLIVFNDVPLSECDKFSEWISQLSKNINIEKIIFCSSFVCELGAVTTYAKRKLYLEKSLAARLDDRLVIFRLRNLVLIGGQWEQRLRHLKSRPVINLSKKMHTFTIMISLKCYINFKVRFLGNMVPISNLAHLILQMTPIFILGFQYLKILCQIQAWF